MQDTARSSQSFVDLLPGDPAPLFNRRSPTNPNFNFGGIGETYNVLCFFGSAGDAVGEATLAAVLANRDVFDDRKARFWGITIDPQDESQGRVANKPPGLRYFFDFDLSVARLYGAAPRDPGPKQAGVQARRFWIVLDPTYRVMKVLPFAPDGSDRDALFTYLRQLPPPERFPGFEVHAPILVLPNVFEPELCRHLISLYETKGGQESGVARIVDGKTTNVLDHSFKRRRDINIEDRAVIAHLQGRVTRRVVPEILKVHQFKVTRMERMIVSCYAAEDEAHFSAHRDNTTPGTAHRRFAVSVNLNSDFAGGEVSFPEYGRRSYKPPAGGAVVFSCSLLHAVSKVTAGRRYAFLPFLYDEAAAKIRERNNNFVDARTVGAYKR